MQMTPDNWDRTKELFEAALQLDSSRRAAFLAENCREESLRLQVEKLLNDYREAGNFLDDPVLNLRTPAPNASVGIQPEEASRHPRPQSEELLATDTSAEAEDPMVGRQLGAYKLVRRIGQGGMAAVFLASRADDEYRKLVALKLVQPGLDSRDLLNRFRNERQTLAGLDHPNIVKLLDGGSTAEGLPFLVMDYVEGRPIDEYCDQHKLSVDNRLHLFGKVCEAVQYANHKLVVHRDLKPSNILVLADGTPKLLDFGIAKVLNPEPSAQGLLSTQTGTRCMTPAYASPEQMRGKAVTPATDIYSLGVVLYELLTGHRPYRLTQHTSAEIERAICEQEPETPSTAIGRVETDTSSDGTPITKTPESVSQTREGPPEKLRRRLRGDLDNIVLKALQKEPRRRYDSVEEFSKDIGRHLQHLPVKARHSTLTYRASKFVRRHTIEVSSTLAILFVVVAAVAFAFNLFGLRDRVLRIDSLARTASVNTSHPFNPKGWVRSTQRGNAFDARPISANINPVVSCESIFNLKLPNTTLTASQSTSGGSFTSPGADPIPNLPSFCRVEGAIRPSPDSDIRFEVWMPSAGWNGKFRAVGNGGFGGSINFDDMAPAIRLGYATASTDSGHRRNDRDATWALRHPEKVVDMGYRAVHEMTEKSKQIIRAFYGQAPAWSFFEGCSNGGRQALMEAQRFPDDYNGILAGAAPMFTTHILAAGLYNSPTDRASYIPPSKIPAISRAVLAACDALDGVNDGILNDPRQCHFDPSALVCAGTDSDNCLTPPQVSQLKKIYRGLQNSKREQLFPGYVPGGEEGEEGWKAWILGSAAPDQALNYIFGLGVFRDMVFDDPSWDFRMVKPERAIQMADKKVGPIIDTQQSNLQWFKDHGGKLILYHGWSDPETPGLMAIDYYNAVLATMGSEDADAFVRLYMAPGMQHCYGGPGPNFFGQFDLSALGGNPQQIPIATDPEHNIFSALEQWVESSAAPGPIIATKFLNDLDPAQGVRMTRPLCPYPQIAKYRGPGDTNNAANFVCSRTGNE
jgi:feruloyl esterase